MDSSQTLHDFVFNLLSNPDARTAFEMDPEGALYDAGLSDITAVDVQDVIPLVMDYAPVHGLADLDTDQLGLGVLEDGPTGAVQQLQLVTQQLPSLGGPSTAEVNAAAAGTLSTGAGELTAWAGASAAADQVSVSAGAEVAGADAFAASQDVSVTLDAPALEDGAVDLGGVDLSTDGLVTTGPVSTSPITDGLTGTLDGVTGSVTGTLDGVTGTLDGVTGPLTGTLDGVTGPLTGGLGLDLGDSTGPAPTAPVEDTVDSTVSQVTGTVGGTQQQLPAGDVVDGVSDLLF